MPQTPVRAGSLISRWVAIGAISAGIVGGVVGLVVGLDVNPRTAWFAVFELGIPSFILGALVGLAGGAIAYGISRLAGRARTSTSETNSP